jgi:hypothetical protein
MAHLVTFSEDGLTKRAAKDLCVSIDTVCNCVDVYLLGLHSAVTMDISEAETLVKELTGAIKRIKGEKD